MPLKKISFYLLIFFLFFLTGCNQKGKQNISADILGNWNMSPQELINLLNMKANCKVDNVFDGELAIVYCQGGDTLYIYNFKNEKMVFAAFTIREFGITNEKNFTALVSSWQDKMKTMLGNKTKILIKDNAKDDIKTVKIHMYNGKQYICVEGFLKKDVTSSVSVQLYKPFNNEGKQLWKHFSNN